MIISTVCLIVECNVNPDCDWYCPAGDMCQACGAQERLLHFQEKPDFGLVTVRKSQGSWEIWRIHINNVMYVVR